MSFVLAVDAVPVVSMESARHSESVIILGLTEKGVSCAMVLSSVVLVQGCGTEIQMPQAIFGR